jgi:hypothetical protein
MKRGPALYLFLDFSGVDSGVRYLREAGLGVWSGSHDDWSLYVPHTLSCNSGVTHASAVMPAILMNCW